MSASEGVPSLDVDPDAYREAAESVAFIKAAVDAANANALRLCMYQQTHDGTLLRMPVSKIPVRGGAMMDYVLAPEDETIVRARTVEFLVQQHKDHPLKHGPAGVTLGSNGHSQQRNGFRTEIDKEQGVVDYSAACQLMKVYTGEDLNEANLRLGYEELAFQPFPRAVEWSSGRQPSMERLKHYRVAIIGAGINGMSTAVHLKRLGIPYIGIDRQADIGGTWYNNTYPGSCI